MNPVNTLKIIELQITAKEAELEALRLAHQDASVMADPTAIQSMMDSVMKSMKGN